MYKNYTYFNEYKSIKKYEKVLIDSAMFSNLIKAKDNKKNIVYITPDVLISIGKFTVSFLLFNYKDYQTINRINQFLDNKR